MTAGEGVGGPGQQTQFLGATGIADLQSELVELGRGLWGKCLSHPAHLPPPAPLRMLPNKGHHTGQPSGPHTTGATEGGSGIQAVTPIIPELETMRKEDHKFQAGLE